MKRIIILTIAIVCGVAFSESFAKKPKKVDLKDSEQAERDKAERELDSLKSALSLYQEMLELEKERMELEREKAILKQRLQQEEEEIPLPCLEEAQSTDEYYGAWAVSDGQHHQSFAVQDAMHKAQFELAKQVGEDVVINNVEVVCRKILCDDYGNFIAYVAIRMPKNK